MDKEYEFNKRVDERIKKLIPEMFQQSLFTKEKLTDTPNDSLSVVNRRYVTLNGTVASRPVSSVATIGQPYFATDTNIPMTYSASGWRNGVGSLVALNN